MKIFKHEYFWSIISCIFITYFSIINTEASDDQNIFGQYIGTFKNTKTQLVQLARLNFIVARDEKNNLDLKALLTLYFGDFSSKEYITYHFNEVRFDISSRILVLTQNDQEIRIKTTQFTPGRFIATVRSNSSGDVGTLDLTSESEVSLKDNEKLTRPLWGEYKTNCQGEEKLLQLTTYRSTKEKTINGNPFGFYEIKGQLGQYIPYLCPFSETSNKPCITNVILSGTYNFFSGDMVLFGKQKSMFCKIKSDGIICDNCYFKKISSEIVESNPYRPITTTSYWNKNSTFLPQPTDTSPTLEGNYWGFLHHEFLDRYQLINLNVMTYQNTLPSDGVVKQVRISAVAKVFFDQSQTAEFLSYNFDEKTYPLLSEGQFVLENMKENRDAILQITSFKNGLIIGNWFSLNFGKIGTFYLTKNEEVLQNIPNEKIYRIPIAGKFSTSDLELFLTNRLGNNPGSLGNPFYPLEFGGYFFYKKNFSPKIMITGGSLDFYTGRMGVEVESGENVVVGEYDFKTNLMKLRWANKPFGAIWPEHNLETFRLMDLW